MYNRCPVASVSLLSKDGMALHCQQHAPRSRTLYVHVRIARVTIHLLTGQNVSVEQSMDGHILALRGIWLMADRYNV